MHIGRGGRRRQADERTNQGDTSGSPTHGGGAASSTNRRPALMMNWSVS
jgi:hypothetical protein